MVFAIDSEVRGCYIYIDVWSAGIDSELPCSSKSAIAKTSMPIHKHTPIHGNPHVTLLIFVVGINFRRKAVTRNLFLKRKLGFFKISKNKFPSKITRYTVLILCNKMIYFSDFLVLVPYISSEFTLIT